MVLFESGLRLAVNVTANSEETTKKNLKINITDMLGKESGITQNTKRNHKRQKISGRWKQKQRTWATNRKQ